MDATDKLTGIAVVTRKMNEQDVVHPREVIGLQGLNARAVGHVRLDDAIAHNRGDCAGSDVVLQDVEAVVAFDHDIGKTGELVLQEVGVGGKQDGAAFRMMDEITQRLRGIVLHIKCHDLETAYLHLRTGLNEQWRRTGSIHVNDLVHGAGGHVDRDSGVQEVTCVFGMVAVLVGHDATDNRRNVKAKCLLYTGEFHTRLDGKYLPGRFRPEEVAVATGRASKDVQLHA